MSARSQKSKRKAVPLASDADQVLRKCRQLRDRMQSEASSAETVPEPAGIPQDIIEVADLSSPQVLEAMESIAINIAQTVLNKKGFVLDIPSRASSNQIYVKEWDRIVLGGKRSTRTFLNVKEARKSAITLRGRQLLTILLNPTCMTGYTNFSFSIYNSDATSACSVSSKYFLFHLPCHSRIL